MHTPYYSKSPPSGSWGEVSSSVAQRFPLQFNSGLKIQGILDYYCLAVHMMPQLWF